MPKQKRNDDLRLRATPYHEAGHAVAALMFGRKIRRATIVPNEEDGTLGHCKSWLRPALFRQLEGTHDSWSAPRLQYEIEGQIIEFLAGVEAERRFTGRNNNAGARTDYSRAADLVMGRSENSDTRNTLFRYLRFRARDLVELRWPMICGVAEALLERKKLRHAEVQEAANRGQFEAMERAQLERASKLKEERRNPSKEMDESEKG